MMLKSRINIRTLLSMNFSKMPFSSSQLQPGLKILQQKAYLASKVIQKITQIDLDVIYSSYNNQSNELKQKALNQVKKQSLSKSLITMIQEEKQACKLSQAAVEHMRSFFTTGVEYNGSIFNQQRITSVSQKQTGELDRRFRFFPTYTVTGLTFKLIQQNDGNSCLFTGHYGISKSISFMLYSMLSNIIAQYNFKTFGMVSPLKAKIKNVPKLIYYNYKQQAESQIFRDMRKILLSQFKSEIPQNILNKCIQMKKQQQLDMLLKQLYIQRHIKIKVVIDQINKYLSQLRKLQILQSKAIDPSEIQSIRQNTKDFIRGVTKVRYQIGKIFFLSSMNPERKSLNSLAQQGGHESLKLVQFKYLDKISKDITMYQIVDCFLFLLQQNINIKMDETSFRTSNQQVNLNQITIKKGKIEHHVRTSLVNHLQKLSGKYILTFYLMRQSLKKFKHQFQPLIKKHLKEESLSNLEQQIMRLFSQVIKDSKQTMKQKIDLFFSKQKTISEQTSYKIKANLFYAACAAKERNQQANSNKFQINYTKEINIDLKWAQQFIDRHLFQVEGGKTYSLIPADFLIQILSPSMNKTFAYLITHDLLDMAKYLDSAGLGTFMQNVFIKMVQQNSVEIYLLFGQRSKAQPIKLINNHLKQYTFKQIHKYEIQKIIKQQQKNINQKLQTKQKTVFKRSERISIKKRSRNPFNFKSGFLNFFQDQVDGLINQANNIYSKEENNHKLVGQHTFLFVPQNQLDNSDTPQTLLKDNSQDVFQIVKQNDNTSKCIDFILLSVDLSQITRPIVTFNAFDMTKSTEQTISKIKNFVQEFCCFEDMNQNRIEIQNTSTKVSVQIKMNYFVLAPGQFNGDLQKELEKDFNQHLKFTSLYKRKDLCHVESKTQANNKCFLDKVGFIQIQENLRVLKDSSSEKVIQGSYLMWKEIEKQLKMKKKKK